MLERPEAGGACADARHLRAASRGTVRDQIDPVRPRRPAAPAYLRRMERTSRFVRERQSEDGSRQGLFRPVPYAEAPRRPHLVRAVGLRATAPAGPRDQRRSGLRLRRRRHPRLHRQAAPPGADHRRRRGLDPRAQASRLSRRLHRSGRGIRRRHRASSGAPSPRLQPRVPVRQSRGDPGRRRGRPPPRCATGCGPAASAPCTPTATTSPT